MIQNCGKEEKLNEKRGKELKIKMWFLIFFFLGKYELPWQHQLSEFFYFAAKILWDQESETVRL